MLGDAGEVLAGESPVTTDLVAENGDVFGQTVTDPTHPTHQSSQIRTLQQEALQQHPTAWSDVDVEDLMPPAFAVLPVLSTTRLTPSLWSIRLDNADFAVPADYPGRELCFRCGSGADALWEPCAISSSPADQRFLEIVLSNQQYSLFLESLRDGPLGIKLAIVQGPVGPFYFNPEKDEGPLVLLAAGSGLAHATSIVRFLHDTGNRTPWQLIHCVSPADRTDARSIADELQSLGSGRVHTIVTDSLLDSRRTRSWRAGKEYLGVLERLRVDVASQFFVSGPREFIDIMDWTLQMTSVPEVCVRNRAL